MAFSLGGLGAGVFLSFCSLASRGFTSLTTSAAVNAGVSVRVFFDCCSSFSSSHDSKPFTASSSFSFSSSAIQGLVSASFATVFSTRATNSRARATALGRRVISDARLIHSSATDLSSFFLASNCAAVESAPSMYSQSSASVSAAEKVSRIVSSVTCLISSSSSIFSRMA